MGGYGCHADVPVHFPFTQSGPLHCPLDAIGKPTTNAGSVEDAVVVVLLVVITNGGTITNGVVMNLPVVAASLAMEVVL
jgi:hypothetical protein